eukprot:sb/3470209/
MRACLVTLLLVGAVTANDVICTDYGKDTGGGEIEGKKVVGPRSGGNDDNTSEAKCPRGMVVGHCTLQGQDFKDKADGVTIEDNGRKCVAHVGTSGGNHLHAVAICVPEDEYKVVTSKKNGRATCPGGTEMVGCVAHSYWGSQFARPGQELGSMERLGKFDARAQLKKDKKYPCEASFICTSAPIGCAPSKGFFITHPASPGGSFRPFQRE